MTGISAMLMDEGLDTGKVLMRRSAKLTRPKPLVACMINWQLNAETLDEVVGDITSLLTTAEPQDDSQALYAAKITPQEAEIDWACDTATLDCHIRAFTPFPEHGVWGQRAVFAFYRPAQQICRPAHAPAGSIVSIGKAALHVATGMVCWRLNTYSQLAKNLCMWLIS